MQSWLDIILAVKAVISAGKDNKKTPKCLLQSSISFLED